MCCRSSRLRVCAAGDRCGPGDAGQQRRRGRRQRRPATTGVGRYRSRLTHRSTRKEMPTVRGAPMKASRPSTPARYRLSVRLLTTRLAPMPFRRGDSLQVEADVGVEHGGRGQRVDVGGIKVARAQVTAGQAEVPVGALPVGRQHQGVLRLADHLRRRRCPAGHHARHCRCPGTWSGCRCRPR